MNPDSTGVPGQQPQPSFQPPYPPPPPPAPYQAYQGGPVVPPPPPAPGFGQPYPPLPPPPLAAAPAPASGTSRRTGYVAAGVALWLLIAGGTAGAVVASGGDSPKHVAALAPIASHSAAPAPTSTPSAAPTTASPTPSPTSTVHGTVSGNSHGGDLRFFLLPVPDGAQVEGDPDGVSESLGDIAKQMDNPSTSRRILHDFGCQGGAYRSFLTNDGVWTVTVHLIHFDGSGHASDWVSGLTFGKGNSFDVSGIGSAKGQSFPPSSSNGEQGLIIGLSHVGDVEYEIDITGSGTPSRSLLTQLMQRQEQRLSTGR